LKRLTDGRHHPFLLRFLISYVFVLIIPVITAALLHQESQRLVIREVRSATEAVIAQATEVVDRTLVSLRIIVDQITIDPEFISLAVTEPPLAGRHYYRMQRVVDAITAQVITQRLLHRYFLYLPNSGYVLAQNTAYQADLFFERAFSYPGMSAEDWVAMSDQPIANARILPGRTVLFQGNDLPSIPVVWSYPIVPSGGQHGIVVFLLDRTEFLTYLERLQLTDRSSVYVTDGDGNLIVEIGGSEAEFEELRSVTSDSTLEYVGAGSRKKLATRISSAYSDLSYVVLTPESYIVQRVSYIRRITVAALIAALLVGAFVAFWFSFRNAKPLRNALRSVVTDGLDDGDSSQNPFDSLQRGVAGLITAKSEADEQLSQQSRYLRETTLRRIVKGEFRNLREILRAATYVGLGLEGSQYLVLAVRLSRGDETLHQHTVEESLLARLVLDDVLDGPNGGYAPHAASVGESEFALILCFDEEQAGGAREAARGIVNEMSRRLGDEYGMVIAWGGGKAVTSLDRACISFDQAQAALRYTLGEVADSAGVPWDQDGHRDGYWFDEIEHPSAGIDYPIELESRAIYLTQAGEFDGVSLLIRENHAVNEALLVDQNKSETYYTLLKNTFYRTGLRCPEFPALVERMMTLDTQAPPDEVVLSISSVFRDACTAVNASKKSHNSRLKEGILGYLEEHYNDPNLTLYSLASQFGVSGGYLSHFFKEQAGVNFSTHLESLRIARAKELLADESIKIQDIVRRVGYTNAYTFRRVFRKVCGASPSEHRDRERAGIRGRTVDDQAGPRG
jgi:two-component system, response regulator YesN